MINEARSLLLNRSGSTSGFVSRLGEEFIPPTFHSVSLPSYLTTIRRTLFGYQPDWLYENYRVRQYMKLLHSTDLSGFITDLDPRVTYDAANAELFDDSQFGIDVTNNADTIRFIGPQPTPDGSGQSIRRWRVTIVDDSTVRIEHLQPYREQLLPYTFSTGSQTFDEPGEFDLALPGKTHLTFSGVGAAVEGVGGPSVSGVIPDADLAGYERLTIKVEDGSMDDPPWDLAVARGVQNPPTIDPNDWVTELVPEAGDPDDEIGEVTINWKEASWSSLVPFGSQSFFISFVPEDGRQWLVEETVRPTLSLGEILASLQQLPGGRMLELFGEGTAQGQTEPWVTFRNLWNNHPLLPFRLGGLLLAVIYRTRERRLAGG